MSATHHLLLGALAMGTLICALIFLRLWRDSADRFFLFFALSFLVQAINRVTLALEPFPNEGSPLHYWVRLLAYVLILVAVADKNRSPSRPTAASDPSAG
jgi:hypothetical protein